MPHTTFIFYCYGDHRDLHSFPTRALPILQPRCGRTWGWKSWTSRGNMFCPMILDLKKSIAIWPRRIRRSLFTPAIPMKRSEEHTSELQSHVNLVCRLLLEKKKEHKPSSDT